MLFGTGVSIFNTLRYILRTPDQDGSERGSYMKRVIEKNEKVNILGFGKEELEAFVREVGEKPFRARQIYRWLYKAGAGEFESMTNLPAAVRRLLESSAEIVRPELEMKQVSRRDGTVKFLFRLRDDLMIESVLIPPAQMYDAAEDMRRLTLCISTQVGCPADCKFCATGTMGFFRNLTVGEILGQILMARVYAPRRISNIVFMGMGEPMLNYDNVMRAVDIISDDEGMGIGAKKITVSTVGYVRKIRQMADEGRKARLAISLHSLDDRIRSRLVPVNKKHNVEELLEAARYYSSITGERVTFEYIYLEGLNDREEDIRALRKLSGKVSCKLNIIPFHPIHLPKDSALGAQFRPPKAELLDRFVGRLRSECDFPVMLRSSSGIDIDGACGQLAVKNAES